MNFLQELQRRNVIRVGIAYVVAAWLLAQVVELAAGSFEAPGWVMKMLITLLVIGLPIVLVFSWAYEITPEGLKREAEVERDQSITHQTARKLNYVTITLLILAISVVILDRFVLEPEYQPASPAVSATGAEQETAGPVTPDVEENSIAVLPFVNMSADPEQEYFSDGISEELLNLLANVEGLTVASRTSSFAYKGAPATSIPEIARDLKVAHVLEGSVRKAGNKVRITAQMIDTRNDRHLWSDSYDRELDDIFAIQDDIANAIVDALRAELGMATTGKAVTVEAVTDNLDAYESFLKARGLLIARSDLAGSVRLFEQAVALDPRFARAWANLAAAAYVAPGWGEVGRDYTAIAEAAAKKALELDDGQSLAWAVRSRNVFQTEPSRNYAASMEYIDRAIELDPKNATARLWRGISWSELGFFDRALSDLERCLAIDPAYHNCLLHASLVHLLEGDGDRAMERFEELAERGFLEYVALHVPFFLRRGDRLVAVLAAHHGSGHPDFPARAWLEALEYPDRDYSHAIAKAEKWFQAEHRAGMYNGLMLAFGAYEKLAAFPALAMSWIWQPGFAGFHESGHFKRMVNELNLDAYWREHGFPPFCRPVGDADFECELP